MRNDVTTLVLTMTLILVSCPHAYSRISTESVSPRIVVSPAIGYGNAGTTVNSLVLVGLKKNNKLYSLSYRYLYTEKFQGLGFFAGEIYDKNFDRGLLITIGFLENEIWLLGGIGVSQINNIDGSTFQERRSFGIPFEFRIMKFESLGIGANIFGNMNNLNSYIGAGLCIGLEIQN